MEIIYELSENLVFKDVILTIGNFDGIHLAHQKIIEKVVSAAAKAEGTSAVLTFDPHPVELFKPEKSPHFLIATSDKKELVGRLNVDLLILLDFNRRLADRTPEEFVDRLTRSLKVKKIIIGENFAFGKGKKGDVRLLCELGKSFGFEVETVSPIKIGRSVVSSTKIRDLLKAGEVEEAAKFLGRPQGIGGEVIKGHSRGERMGYPTANIKWPKDLLLPKDGVYAAYAQIEGRSYSGMAHLGSCPTFNETGRSLEINLFDFRGDLYGRFIRIFFLKRLRDQIKFDSPEELKQQLNKDKALSKTINVGWVRTHRIGGWWVSLRSTHPTKWTKLLNIAKKVKWVTSKTKYGWIVLGITEAGLCQLVLSKKELVLGEEGRDVPPFLNKLKEGLISYFEGERVRFDEYPLDLKEATPFQRKVFRACQKISYGQVRSYEWIAREIGSPKSARAVGGALSRNPLPIIIPCHRVIRKDNSLGGFSSGLKWKRILLELEGIKLATENTEFTEKER
ncbi:bifunctional riboflavin kinase/FAD synthetase [bacterium]|nr:bifunctional riboflavin kinase/FAD synthetase [bacterium]MBU1614875.1 bifunctional riboflavin kinase/FAD synthetase [bacterium]